ncbi:DEAD/DEAH box helicase [Luteolibacter sp. GHJ8]|uniref:DEAD/DEAH box helicase n=1 Tax=Luteolibacter rhizosphaerae TaxID=2989719 RepID=A0ABT3G329_9BACT|nr:DEAD/DEAH box helicase [Luteolibacter rhizosphaerae]MCW1914257.1 DEAD/DEAH box helicase [Luteolibacter rhizosphaerae]
MTPTPFEALPLAAPLHRALRELEYTTPSPIQAQAIPILLEGRDLLGSAQTGTGKTAGFALPILHALHEKPKPLKQKTARTLVLTPTRELAVQVAKSFTTYGRHVRFRQTLIYGGVGQNPQVAAMKTGVDVLVATPGRLLDLIDQKFLDLSGVEFFVLDEVDRMLDMGFQRDVTRIVGMLPKQRQSLFFSATMAPNIVKLAETILTEPAKVTIAPQSTTAERVEQKVAFVHKEHKRSLLEELLKEQASATDAKLTIVFSRTKHGANKLAKGLTAAGFQADAIHGNKSQAQREKALERFRKGLVPVLVATDVAARGVDVKDVGLVVNYDLPNEPEAYVHRIGRTGRAGAEGRSVSFCSEEELEYLRDIEKIIRMSVPRWDDHRWHDDAVADRHARGVRVSAPVKVNANKPPKRQGDRGNRGERQPQNQTQANPGGSEAANPARRRRRRRSGGGGGRFRGSSTSAAR